MITIVNISPWFPKKFSNNTAATTEAVITNMFVPVLVVARNQRGLLIISNASLAPLEPLTAFLLSLSLLEDISIISEPEKKPWNNIQRNIIIIFKLIMAYLLYHVRHIFHQKALPEDLQM